VTSATERSSDDGPGGRSAQAGAAPVVWRAPGRVNLIGEHTDYNDGFALPFAIAEGCTTTVSRLDRPVLRLSSAQEDAPVEVALDGLEPDAVQDWAAYPAGVVWALRRHTPVSIDGGLDIHVDGDVPLGAGLSSSAALSCSTAAALNDFFGLDLAQADLVALSRTAENDFVGAPTGGMDQLASVCSTADHALLCDMQSLTTEQVPFGLAAASLTVLVIDTRAPHRHADGEYAARRQACEKAAQLLGVDTLRDVQDRFVRTGSVGLEERGADAEMIRRVRHVLTENQRVLQVVDLLRAGEVEAIGSVLSASHASMRDDFEITVPEVDVAAEAATAAGALGARMTGGGFGGCVIALTSLDDVDAVSSAVQSAFAAKDFREPHIFQVRPGPGAHKL
jgi:galactokinase